MSADNIEVVEGKSLDKKHSEILNTIVNRIVEASNPIRIVLFGSAAKGKMTETSDFDIMVVVKDGTHRRKTAQQLYKSISDIGFATDIIVVCESDVELYKDEISSVIHPAINEGRILYAA